MENGKIAVARHLHNGLACGSTEFHVLRPHDGVLADYLWRYLRQNSFRRDAEQSMTGAVGQRRVPADFLRSTVLPLSPSDEQRRIVAKIDSLSAKSKRARGQLDHIPRLVEKYKQAILAAAFRGNLTHEWRMKRQKSVPLKAFNEPNRQKKPTQHEDFVAPYEVPDGWTWLALPQIGDIDRGRSRHRPRNDPSLFGGPWPFIQTGDVRAANRFLTSFTETYSEFGLSQSRLWPKGTVCITIAANIAETAILAIDACFPDSVVGFTADIERTTPSYVEFFLRTARDELTAFAPATAQKNINLETLSRIQLPMAPLDEQREIVDRIEKAFSWIDRLATETTNARKLIDHLDQAVMAKAFRGELVPQDPNDEPASVLLERIQAEKQSKQPRRREHIARSRA